MRTRSRWTALAAGAVLLVVLGGCGDDLSGTATDDGTDDPQPSATSIEPAATETAAHEGGCPYLAAEQVTEALGSPSAETAGTVNACFFDPESGEGPSVMLSRIDIQIDPAKYAAQSKALCQGDLIDVDAGDEAFACVAGLGPQGQLYVDRVLVTVAVNDAADDAAGLAAAVALLPLVTVPPTS